MQKKGSYIQVSAAMSHPGKASVALFDEAFREHRGRLYQYLRRRLANEEDAQDLAQEAYLRLLRVSRTELVRDPQAYLYRVARNLVYEQGAKAMPVSPENDGMSTSGLGLTSNLAQFANVCCSAAKSFQYQ